MLAALDTEQTLLLLKIGFLVLLYLFIWSVVRSVTRDLRSAPQESIVLSAQEANELRSRYEPVVQAPVARMLVLESPALQVGSTVELKVPVPLCVYVPPVTVRFVVRFYVFTLNSSA